MLISGSTALQFFNRTDYPDSDLDIYVEHRRAIVVGHWLQSIGYAFVPRARQPQEFRDAYIETLCIAHPGEDFFPSEDVGYFGRGVANVFNFLKFRPERKIQLITSLHSPLEVILHFHSTCVMNVISHETAYALYPLATYEHRRSLICVTEGSRQDAARAKYVSRGWTMEPSLPSWETTDRRSDCMGGNRWIGDASCWKIKIQPALGFGPDFVGSNTWSHRYSGTFEAQMNLRILKTPVLHFSYLVADEEVQNFIRPALVALRLDKEFYDDDVHKLLKCYFEISRRFRSTF